jgi:hypothetical protein
MKNFVGFLFFLFLVILSIGCVSRIVNPSIEVSADQKYLGSRVENLVDAKNSYIITFNITNNASSIAKNVKVDYSYCNTVGTMCEKGVIDHIGDLQPFQSIIRTVKYDRSGFIDYTAIEKFQFNYQAKSEY